MRLGLEPFAQLDLLGLERLPGLADAATCPRSSVASLYRALAEAEAAAVDEGLPLRPKPVPRLTGDLVAWALANSIIVYGKGGDIATGARGWK